MTVSNKEPKVLQDSDGCEHLWLDYEPAPCPTCAEIKAAKDKRGKEVLEMAEHFIGAMIGPNAWKRFGDIYKERFGS